MFGFIRNNPLYTIILSLTSILAAAWTINTFIPNHRSPCQPPACINNLRQIDAAKEQWSLETHRSSGAPPVIYEINRYIKGGRPSCPQGGSYSYGNVGESPRCTITNHTLR